MTEDEQKLRAGPPSSYPQAPPPQQAFNPYGAGYPEQYPSYPSDQGPFAPYHPSQPDGAGYGKAPPSKLMKNEAGSSSGIIRQEYEGVWHDIWAAVLFILHLLAIVVVAIILGKKGMDKTKAFSSQQPSANGTLSQRIDSYDIKHIGPPLGVSGAVGAVFSLIWLALMKAFPRALIKVSLWGSVIFLTVLGLVVLSANNSGGMAGLFFLFLAVLQALYAYIVRHRIPFAGCILAKVVSVIRMFPGTVVVSFLALVASAAWLSLWTFGAAGALSQTHSAVIIFLLLLSLYWTMEVLRNIVHVTVSGTVATYYFQQLNMPPHPTRRALGRALGKSFGSICFGSLIVAAIQAVRALLRQARQSGDNAILLCCLDCLLSCIEALVQYINKYAYVQVAVYGKGFIRAAKDTWDLFRSQGIEVLINDDLTGSVLWMGCLISGGLCALTGGGWTLAIGDKNLAGGIAVITFCIGFFMTYLTMVVVESGVASYYVCYAEDPAALQRNDPEFYMQIQDRQRELTGRPDSEMH